MRNLFQHFSQRVPSIFAICRKDFHQTSEKCETCFSIFYSECRLFSRFIAKISTKRARNAKLISAFFKGVGSKNGSFYSFECLLPNLNGKIVNIRLKCANFAQCFT